MRRGLMHLDGRLAFKATYAPCQNVVRVFSRVFRETKIVAIKQGDNKYMITLGYTKRGASCSGKSVSVAQNHVVVCFIVVRKSNMVLDIIIVRCTRIVLGRVVLKADRCLLF